jgi:hypothetical protein
MSSRRRLTRGVAAMSIAALSLLAPAAALGRTATVPTLGAVNQITAAGTSSVKVRLASSMPLFLDHGQIKGGYIQPGLTVSDPSRFVAVALVADQTVRFPNEPNYLQHPSFLVWRMPTGSTTTITDSANVPARVLPAGTYRLTVVATGPVHLTWRLPLSGHASLRTTTPATVHYDVKTWTGPVPMIDYAVHAETAQVAQVWESVWIDAIQPAHTGGGAWCVYSGTQAAAAGTENVPGLCDGIGGFGGPVDGVYVPPTVESDPATPRAGVVTVDATQRVNSEYLPEVGVKATLYRLGTIRAATAFHLWLPVG